jgi:hypothetical protein
VGGGSQFGQEDRHCGTLVTVLYICNMCPSPQHNREEEQFNRVFINMSFVFYSYYASKTGNHFNV